MASTPPVKPFYSQQPFQVGAAVAGLALLVYILRRLSGAKPSSGASSSRTKSSTKDTTYTTLTTTDDLSEGSCKEVAIGNDKILLAKSDGKVYAVGRKCSHQGALLKTGSICNGRIRCPVHGAAFSLETGDIEEYPCTEGIHTFPVTETSTPNQVKITATSSKLRLNYRKAVSLTTPIPSDKRIFAIVGAGPAGLTCASSLREGGYTGRVLLIGKEKHLPYDRTKLSKAMSKKAPSIVLQKEEWFEEAGIELMLDTTVTELKVDTQTLHFEKKESIKYDKVFLAPGGFARVIPVPGIKDGKNIHFLRVVEEANEIIETAKGKRLIIVGSSFIGMEVASCLAGKATEVHVIGMEAVPFERVLGAKIGAVLQTFHETKGVHFHMSATVTRFNIEEGRCLSVTLNNGETLEGDVFVVGAGIIPATSFVDKSLETARDRSLIVNKYLAASEHVFVGGDCARYPDFVTGEKIRVEHLAMAMYHGKVAALNMLGRSVEVHSVPFFWTTQGRITIRYCGHALKWDEIAFEGSLEDFKFAAYYLHGEKVMAVASINYDPVVANAAELMNAGKMPSASVIRAQLKQHGKISLPKL